ncbi:hypothetical protein F0562_018004 [Nyssa sinensis]|uniref:Uncharacterized protein n=1 Tax=Nyssa sinensis TaxID=561372 RepID=A0A5J4Z8A1_9ASTE|nr:hypothetical protein F0562_018004 [Nyssa sinensis]
MKKKRQEDEELANLMGDGLNVDHIPDKLEENISSSSGDGEGERGPQKLTRAQRKRLRKKKLKEEASPRRKVVGPLLPTTSDDGKGDDGNNVIKNEPQGVCSNATEFHCLFLSRANSPLLFLGFSVFHSIHRDGRNRIMKRYVRREWG